MPLKPSNRRRTQGRRPRPRRPQPRRSSARSARRSGCEAVIALLTEYLEGGLRGATLAALEAHLAGCGACSQYFETLRTTRRAVRTLQCASIPGELHARLRAFLRLRDAAARATDG